MIADAVNKPWQIFVGVNVKCEDHELNLGPKNIGRKLPNLDKWLRSILDSLEMKTPLAVNIDLREIHREGNSSRVQQIERLE